MTNVFGAYKFDALMGGGSSDAATPQEIEALQSSLKVEFAIGWHLLLPLLLMLTLVYKRFPAYPSIVISALVGAVFGGQVLPSCLQFRGW